ncbi:MAG: GFA family protein [Gaiellaceae bacterium]
MSVQQPVPGSCICGGIRFEVEPPFEAGSYCHCSRCRKHSGNFGSASLRAGNVRVLAGVDLIGSWQPAPGAGVKGFCKRCGSSLFGGDWPDGPSISVRLGALDADPGVRPRRHIWVGSRGFWDELPEDGLPRFDEGSPG